MIPEQSIHHCPCKKNKKHASCCSRQIPLGMVSKGHEVFVHSIKGKDDTKRFLKGLGFVENAKVCVINQHGGNLIVTVKGTRIAISQAMVNRIYTY